MAGRARDVVAGGAAAAVWALQEPLDRRVVGCDYSDVAILGKAVTRGRAWWPAGFALHVANGMLFGLAFHEVRRRRPVDGRALALGMALGEHLALYPLSGLVDRHHPRRGSSGIPPLLSNRRAFAQATWRHALFGVVLGRLAARQVVARSDGSTGFSIRTIGTGAPPVASSSRSSGRNPYAV